MKFFTIIFLLVPLAIKADGFTQDPVPVHRECDYIVSSLRCEEGYDTSTDSLQSCLDEAMHSHMHTSALCATVQDQNSRSNCIKNASTAYMTALDRCYDLYGR